MDKVYDPKKYETLIYSTWEKAKAFTPQIDKQKKPFTIILPLPNANDPMHMGHALFTVEDILIRYHRMLGDPSLWLPGGDHAGIETQFVFEKYLATSGKSRFDYDRETLYKMIWDFANKNKDLNKNQMKLLGFSMDWSRYHYSLEPEIVDRVMQTFTKLYRDELVYRGERIVNYCTHCGTAFSDLEINYKERQDHLYYLDYGIITIATTRPETIFADVAIAVNPKDKKYIKLLGKNATIPLINIKIPIIADENIDPKFGTGALKVTPAHDQLDYEIGIKNNLEIINVIEQTGRMTVNDRVPKEVQNLYVNKAREETLKLLEKSGKLIKAEPLTHSVSTCYKCGFVIEPLVVPQWFVKTKPLAIPAIDAVKKGKTKIFPKQRFEKLYFDWMENIHDWNISRQIVWGPRIPILYCLKCNSNIQIYFIDSSGKKIGGQYKDLSKKYKYGDILNGLQSISAPKNASHQLENSECKDCGSHEIVQETDTFDTWFLSGQWPLTTLGFNINDPEKSSEDFKYFYPTSVLDTLWDILFFWVGRMMMFGLYLTGDVPFKTIHLHARVVDKHGKKMSKSKGNVVDPITLVEKYGADALRMSLVMGVGPASDIAISDEKVLGMRNFTNKLWNITRFIEMKLKDAGIENYDSLPSFSGNLKGISSDDKIIIDKLNQLIKYSGDGIDNYKFGLVSEKIYSFVWHDFADKYIESVKERLSKKEVAPLITLRHVLFTILGLLHPFMPFVTEAIWQETKNMRTGKIKFSELLINSKWPEVV